MTTPAGDHVGQVGAVRGLLSPIRDRSDRWGRRDKRKKTWRASHSGGLSIVDPEKWTSSLDRMPQFRPGDRRGEKDV